MPWNLDSDRPIYLQLMERIQHDIISGNWRELVWYTPAVQADDLLRRTKQ